MQGLRYRRQRRCVCWQRLALQRCSLLEVSQISPCGRLHTTRRIDAVRAKGIALRDPRWWASPKTDSEERGLGHSQVENLWGFLTHGLIGGRCVTTEGCDDNRRW